jgi:SAM-dependent methyltransferase
VHDVDRIIGTIDAERFADITQRYARHSFAKYLDLPSWIERNLRRAERLKLNKGIRRRVLDIGCGCGYFLYICKLFGHDVVGIDLPGQAMYEEITELLGVPVTHAKVEAFKPFPHLGAFDVVTAHMICFNGHRTDRVWGPDEWKCFLDSLDAPTVCLDFNREPDGRTFSPELERFFASRGATIAGYRIVIER